MEKINIENRRFKREFTNMPLFVGIDITKAETIDVSVGGIRILTENPLIIHLHRKIDDHLQQQIAKLVWAKKTAKGMEYGFEYIYE